MFLSEMFKSYPTAYQDPGEDKTPLRGLKDMRKTRLTLAQINKIRVMNDLRSYEKEKELERIQAQYGAAEEGGGDEL